MDYFVASIMIANIDQYFVLGIIDQNIGILNLGFLNQLINIIPIILGIPIDAKYWSPHSWIIQITSLSPPPESGVPQARKWVSTGIV